LKFIAATGDSVEHEEEFLGFMKEDAHEASNTLYDILQVNNLQTWVHKDDETPFAVFKDDDGTVAEVLNHGRAEYLLEDDSKIEEMCDLETPKISRVLDSISEMMNWMARQSCCDCLHLLHLQNIKMYMTKKHHQLLHQKKNIKLF
jgi:hypothetical protein